MSTAKWILILIFFCLHICNDSFWFSLSHLNQFLCPWWMNSNGIIEIFFGCSHFDGNSESLYYFCSIWSTVMKPNDSVSGDMNNKFTVTSLRISCCVVGPSCWLETTIKNTNILSTEFFFCLLFCHSYTTIFQRSEYCGCNISVIHDVSTTSI